MLATEVLLAMECPTDIALALFQFEIHLGWRGANTSHAACVERNGELLGNGAGNFQGLVVAALA